MFGVYRYTASTVRNIAGGVRAVSTPPFLQAYLAHKKLPPPTTLQYDCA
jgi:hypothetical protein